MCDDCAKWGSADPEGEAFEDLDHRHALDHVYGRCRRTVHEPGEEVSAMPCSCSWRPEERAF